jgi:MraZ protein
MPGFVGRYEHSLDSKGRIILPSRFREVFPRKGFLTRNREGCVALWTPGEFDRQLSQMQIDARVDRAARNRARLWSSSSSEVDIDQQGRMAVPLLLREFAHLDGEVLVIGAIDRIELWSPAVWAEKVQPDEDWFLEDEG